MSAEKPGWLRRRIAALGAAGRRMVEDPRQIGVMARERAVRLWVLRGGGWYGLGYVIAFVVLEIRMFFGDVAESDDVISFLGQQALEIVFRFAVESLVNGLVAFLWPFFVLDYMGGWGVVVLLVSWWAFGQYLAPRFAKLIEDHKGGDA